MIICYQHSKFKKMANIATLITSFGFRIPGLRDTWIGHAVMSVVKTVEAFIVSHPQLDSFVTKYPGIAAIIGSTSLWLIALPLGHIAFFCFSKMFGSPSRAPNEYVMSAEMEEECRRKLDGPFVQKEQEKQKKKPKQDGCESEMARLLPDDGDSHCSGVDSLSPGGERSKRVGFKC